MFMRYILIAPPFSVSIDTGPLVEAVCHAVCHASPL